METIRIDILNSKARKLLEDLKLIAINKKTHLEDDSELDQKKRLTKSNFSFQRTWKLLSDYKGSFSDAVIEEREGGL